MHPILIKIGKLEIPTYGFLLAIGVLFAIIYILRSGKKAGLDTTMLGDLIFYTLLSGIIGGKLLLLLINLRYYLNFPAELKYLIVSGGSFHGGLIAGLIFFLLFVKRKKLKLARIGDVFAPAIALAHFFGRLGCFSAGCCFGREANNVFCAVTFTSNRAHDLTGVPLNIPIYPTQLIEALLNLINFILLFLISKKSKRQGTTFALYFINYGLIRFFVEFLRGDPDRGYVFGSPQDPLHSLSVPQLISLFLIILGCVLLIIYRRNEQRDQAAS